MLNTKKMLAPQHINFDKEKAKNLKEHWQEAVNSKKTQFTFENKDFLTEYAKYVVQFLESKFGKL